jgi:two-component system, OmpR family, alkaline phosphatase synthesis response regulator PhoP
MNAILIIEDERDIATGIQANLEIEGYTATVAHTGAEGLRIALAHSPMLIVLDLMLPDLSGFEVLSRLRAAGCNAPVLILSARAEELDKVRGFRTGADDYVTKPFGVMELMLRVRALLRRSAAASTPSLPDVHHVGDAQVDLHRRVVMRDGKEVPLTPRAFELLAALLKKRGMTVTRHELLRDVWGYSSGVTTRTIDAHIAELRRRLEVDSASPQHVLTVWKSGYRLRE